METDETLFETRFLLNMKRVNDLWALILPSKAPPQSTGVLESKTLRGDLGRAVVVFIHATFEDVLRTVARQRLDAAKLQDLDGIPLVGAGRGEKFKLGALDAHRGKTVDQLIHESVEDYLNRQSFGSCGDVEEVLRRIGLDTEPFKPLYADLDQLMKWRHRIVHEADLPTPKDSVSPPWTFGDDFQLCLGWVAVMTFFAQLCVVVDPADELQRLYLARRSKALELAREARAELIALQNQPAEALVLGAQKAIERLREVRALLGPPSAEEMFLLWKKMKSPDDDTTDEQARAKIIAWRDNRK